MLKTVHNDILPFSKNEQGLNGLTGAPGSQGFKGEKVQTENKVNDEIVIILNISKTLNLQVCVCDRAREVLLEYLEMW